MLMDAVPPDFDSSKLAFAASTAEAWIEAKHPRRMTASPAFPARFISSAKCKDFTRRITGVTAKFLIAFQSLDNQMATQM
jgi:hypothetical protein